ncbi:MAG: energy transducer TonB [Chryseolinea sp.]
MKIVFASLLFLISSAALAQTPDSVLVDVNTIYDVVDLPAQPNGGLTAFFKTIATNIQYPADARKNGIAGKVFVEFVIEADGTIRSENVRIAKSVSKSIDKEAKRVVLLTSPWTPAKKGDKNVRSRRTLPITFNM